MARRLTADARKTLLTAATQEAGRRGDRRLGTDHLLLGLLHDPDSFAASALSVSLERARAMLDALDLAALAAVGVAVAAVGEPPPAAFGRRLPPLTSGARAVLKRAVEEAGRARAERIGTGHFLLALVSRERPDPAAELMFALGIDPGTVRERLARSNQGEPA
jgi:ATP-dependent Clp protease ATP-binding subunit ClpA